MTDKMPVALSQAEYDHDYYGELRWWDAGEDRRPAYRVRIVDKGMSGGKVRLAREVMSRFGPKAPPEWDEVLHPAADLFLYEMPYEPDTPGPPSPDTKPRDERGGVDAAGSAEERA